MKKVTPDMVRTLLLKSTLVEDFTKKQGEKEAVDGKEVIGVINGCTWQHEGRAINVLATIAGAEGIAWSKVDVRSDSLCKEVRAIATNLLRDKFPGLVWEKSYTPARKQEVAAADLAAAFLA